MRRRTLPALLLATLLLGGVAGPAWAQAEDEIPFVTTPDNVTRAMLELAQVGPGDFVLDLGSGDGRIVITAATRFGARGLGVEISPDLVERSRRNAERAGVADRAKFAEKDLFQTDLSAASVITMYLLQEVNLQLRPALLALRPGTRVVSHDWDLGDWKPDRSITVDAPDKSVGLDKRSRLHLWVVPAPMDGRWCTTAANRGATLHLQQHYQQVRARLILGGQSVEWPAEVRGTRLVAAGGFEAGVDGALLRIIRSAGTLPGRLDGAEFERCPG